MKPPFFVGKPATSDVGHRMAILCPGPSQEKPRSPEDAGDHRDLEPPARAGWGDKMTEEKGGCNTFHDQNMDFFGEVHWIFPCSRFVMLFEWKAERIDQPECKST